MSDARQWNSVDDLLVDVRGAADDSVMGAAAVSERLSSSSDRSPLLGQPPLSLSPSAASANKRLPQSRFRSVEFAAYIAVGTQQHNERSTTRPDTRYTTSPQRSLSVSPSRSPCPSPTVSCHLAGAAACVGSLPHHCIVVPAERRLEGHHSQRTWSLSPAAHRPCLTSLRSLPYPSCAVVVLSVLCTAVSLAAVSVQQLHGIAARLVSWMAVSSKESRTVHTDARRALLCDCAALLE